jgi:hypothetical protein
MGSCTGPCGKVRIDARAFVTCNWSQRFVYIMTLEPVHTEHFASKSNFKAVGRGID